MHVIHLFRQFKNHIAIAQHRFVYITLWIYIFVWLIAKVVHDKFKNNIRNSHFEVNLIFGKFYICKTIATLIKILFVLRFIFQPKMDQQMLCTIYIYTERTLWVLLEILFQYHKMRFEFQWHLFSMAMKPICMKYHYFLVLCVSSSSSSSFIRSACDE